MGEVKQHLVIVEAKHLPLVHLIHEMLHYLTLFFLLLLQLILYLVEILFLLPFLLLKGELVTNVFLGFLQGLLLDPLNLLLQLGVRLGDHGLLLEPLVHFPR